MGQIARSVARINVPERVTPPPAVAIYAQQSLASTVSSAIGDTDKRDADLEHEEVLLWHLQPQIVRGDQSKSL